MTRYPYMQINYYRGKPQAAYLYFFDSGNEPAAKTKEIRPGLVVDFAADGRPLGLEIVDPASVTLQEVNEVLQSLNKEALPEEELAPLKAG